MLEDIIIGILGIVIVIWVCVGVVLAITWPVILMTLLLMGY